jgi:integrase
MKTVQPIRDKLKIDAMKKILYGSNFRDYVFFTLGINSGLRISDLLSLKFNDILIDKNIVKEITLKEKKTGKTKTFSLSDKTRKIIKEYISTIDEYNLDEPLFFSRKKKDGQRIPITRQHAHKILSDTANLVGIDDNIGTHSLRKTFGYHAYKKGFDLSHLQKIFNHATPRQTLDYIGITKDEIDNIYITIDL